MNRTVKVVFMLMMIGASAGSVAAQQVEKTTIHFTAIRCELSTPTQRKDCVFSGSARDRRDGWTPPFYVFDEAVREELFAGSMVGLAVTYAEIGLLDRRICSVKILNLLENPVAVQDPGPECVTAQ